MNKWPKDLRKGDVVVDDNGNGFPVVKVVPVFGGSWFDIHLKGIDEPVTFGHSEKVPVKP